MKLILLTLVLALFAVSKSGNIQYVETRTPKVFYGSTRAFQKYPLSENGIFVEVEFSVLNLKKTPMVFGSLNGLSSHWSVTGMSSFYDLTNKSFRVYMKTSENWNLTTAFAKEQAYVYNYQIVSNDDDY